MIDEDAIILTKMYQINIGYDKEPIEVNAAVLYKFHRIQDISTREKERPRNRSREVIFREISEQLHGGCIETTRRTETTNREQAYSTMAPKEAFGR